MMGMFPLILKLPIHHNLGFFDKQNLGMLLGVLRQSMWSEIDGSILLAVTYIFEPIEEVCFGSFVQKGQEMSG